MSLILNAINTSLKRANKIFDTKPWKAYEERFDKLRDFMGMPVHLDLFRPEMFVLAYLGFLVLGINVATRWTAITIAALFAFYIGTKLSNIPKKSNPTHRPSLNMLLLVLLISILAEVYDLMYIGGTPLLDPSLFRNHLVVFTTTAFLMVPATALILAKTGKKHLPKTALLFMFTLFMMALLGYRTEVFVCLISFAITLFYMGELRRGDLLLLGLLLFGTVVGLGMVKASSAGTATLNVLTTRAESTLAINDYIAQESGLFGIYHGRVHLSGITTLFRLPGPRYGPRTLIANAVSSRPGVTITATMLGPLLLDFGIIGAILEMGLLGFLLGYMHRSIDHGIDAAVYGVLFSFALISIETGLVDGIVLIYYTLGTIYFLDPLKSVHGNEKPHR